MPQTLTVIEPQLISGEELWEMGDIGPCELIEGRIVMTSPTNAEHGFIEVNTSFIKFSDIFLCKSIKKLR